MDSTVEDTALKTADPHHKNRLATTHTLLFPFQKPFFYTWLPIIVLFMLALAFNLYQLGTPSIWFDEAFSVELARQPIPILWHVIFGPEPNMELYYLILHYWLALASFFGLHQTEFIVRLPSALFSAISAPILFLFGRRFLGQSAGIVAGLLFLMNNLQLTYAQQARSYALETLFNCIAWYALLVVLTRSTQHKQWWIVFIITTSLSIYTQLFSVLILCAQFVAVVGILLPHLRQTQTRQQLLAFIVSLLFIGILIIPMALVSLHGAKNGWLPSPNLKSVYHLFLDIAGQKLLYLGEIIFFVLFGLLMLLLIPYAATHTPALRRFVPSINIDKGIVSLQNHKLIVWSLLCWLIVPIALSYLDSQGTTRLFASRYLVVIVPALCLLVGFGVIMVHRRVLQVVLVIQLACVAFSTVPYYYQHAQLEDWRPPATWLAEEYKNGDGLVCYDNIQGCQITIEYYLHAYPNSGAHFTADSPGLFSWENDGPAIPGQNASTAVDTNALAHYAAQHHRFFFITARLSGETAPIAQHAQQWLDSQYHFMQQIKTSTVTIRLYQTDSHPNS